jgi:hypothetical protein
MRTSVSTDIAAPRKKVWAIISDIENATKNIPAIEAVEILHKPKGKLVGLKWKETRTMFGKKATETMWITDAVVDSFYKTRAESHGAIYVSKLSLADHDGGTRLTMEFDGKAVTFGAKLMWGLMGWMFKGATRKALQADLEAIKKAVEKGITGLAAGPRSL